jgi:tetratricopeptide (TPR) repeat protein
VNVAARLQQSAQPGEVLVGGMTRRLAYEAFDFTPRDTMAVKGRAESVEAWRLENALPDGPRMRGGEARLVGRDRELASLASALEEAREGRGLMVAVVGEPGIGKSRLALETVRRAEADGFASAWTSSRSYASAVPYHLIGQLVTQLLQRAAGDEAGTETALRAAGTTADEATISTWSRVLDDLLGVDSDDPSQLADVSPAGRQRIMVHAIGALLRARSSSKPMAVVLDDLHWADPASLAIVEELLTILPELRVALLVTYRSNWSHGWEGRSAYEQVNLRPLRADDARRLASELTTGAAISDEITERVLERSGGNPLFLEELVHGERTADPATSHRLPASIHEMLLARLDALPADARRALQLASVVGMEFSESVVAALGEHDAAATAEALRVLQRAELVQARGLDASEPVYVFRHPLIHEVAYGSLLTSTRRAIHGRVGRWLEEHGGDDRFAELARHYQHSDDRERARRYLRLAAERAHELNATREAFDWYMAAAEAHADDPGARGRLLEAAAYDIHLLGETQEAARIQQDAVDLHRSAGDERAAANARIWLGRYLWLMGRPDDAAEQNVLAVDGLEPYGPSPELAMAYSFRSQSVMLIPEFDAGEQWARRAIEIAEEIDARAVLVHAYNNLGTCLMGRGDRAGIDHLLRSRDLALEDHLPDEVGRAINNLANQGSRIFPMGYEEMDRLLVEGVAYAGRTIPNGIFDRWLRAARSEFLISTGRWQEAEQMLFGLDADATEAYWRGEIVGLRGQLYAYRGRYDEAAAMTAGLPETALRVGDLQAVLPVLSTDAAIRIGLEDDAGAVETLREAIRRRGTIEDSIISAWFAFEATDGLTIIALRDPESAALREGLRLVAEFCRTIARDVARPGDLVHVEVRRALFGAAIEQLASLGRRLGVAVHLPDGVPGTRASALDVLEREHRVFDVARLRLWLAEDGDPSGVADARAAFEELGAHPYLARAAAIAS